MRLTRNASSNVLDPKRQHGAAISRWDNEGGGSCSPQPVRSSAISKSYVSAAGSGARNGLVYLPAAWVHSASGDDGGRSTRLEQPNQGPKQVNYEAAGNTHAYESASRAVPRKTRIHCAIVLRIRNSHPSAAYRVTAPALDPARPASATTVAQRQSGPPAITEPLRE